MATSSTIVIEEIDSSTGSGKRQVVLAGPGLPFQGAEWAGANRLTTQWYPGNGDEATQQVLGPKELPSTWNGDWRRTMLGRAPCLVVDDSGGRTSVHDPLTIAQALEDIFRGGKRLRVTWQESSDFFYNPISRSTSVGPASWKIVREGRASEWHFKVTRSTDVEWSIQFDWLGRGGETPKVSTTRSNNITTDVGMLTALAKKLKGLDDLKALARQNPGSLTLGQLEQLANLPTQAMKQLSNNVNAITSQVGDLVNVVHTIGKQPYSVLGAAVDLAHNTVAKANAFVDTIGSMPIERMALRQKMDSMLRAYSQLTDRQEVSRQIARASTDFAARVRRTEQASSGAPISGGAAMGQAAAIRAHVVKQGETPQTISRLYYGTPDRALDILRANRLPWHTASLTPGKAIIIPALQDQYIARFGA